LSESADQARIGHRVWPFNRLNRGVEKFKNRPLRSNERVAIMLLSVTPQLAATVYRYLTPEQIKEINHQMSRLIYIEDRQRVDIIGNHMGIPITPELETRQDLLSVMVAALEAYIRTDAEKAARSFELLLDNWPRTGPPATIKDASGPAGQAFEWNDAAEAAVLFMSLPPDKSAALFAELGPINVQKITLEICRLPRVVPSTRARIIRKFLEIEQGNPSTKALQETLESVVGASPRRSSERIREIWPAID